jgi:hypothetical protein
LCENFEKFRKNFHRHVIEVVTPCERVLHVVLVRTNVHEAALQGVYTSMQISEISWTMPEKLSPSREKMVLWNARWFARRDIRAQQQHRKYQSGHLQWWITNDIEIPLVLVRLWTASSSTTHVQRSPDLKNDDLGLYFFQIYLDFPSHNYGKVNLYLQDESYELFLFWQFGIFKDVRNRIIL